MSYRVSLSQLFAAICGLTAAVPFVAEIASCTPSVSGCAATSTCGFPAPLGMGGGGGGAGGRGGSPEPAPVPCRYHSDCPDSACNVFDEVCMDVAPVVVGQRVGDLRDAIAGVEGEAVFLLEADSPAYVGGISPPRPGTTVAVIALGGRPVVTPSSETAARLATVNAATLMLEGVQLLGNAGPRLEVRSGGRLALDRVDANTGRVQVIDIPATLLIRNSILNFDPTSSVGTISLGGGSMRLLYSTIGGRTSIDCTEGHDLVVSNSILFARSGDLLTGCETRSVSQTAASEVISGVENVDFGAPDQTPALFNDFANGDLRLTSDGLTTFEDVARWRDGDPPVDIDGTARPTEDGARDVAGAHLGPP